MEATYIFMDDQDAEKALNINGPQNPQIGDEINVPGISAKVHRRVHQKDTAGKWFLHIILKPL